MVVVGLEAKHEFFFCAITVSRAGLRHAPILAICTRNFQGYWNRSMKLSIRHILPTLESNGLCSLYVCGR